MKLKIGDIVAIERKGFEKARGYIVEVNSYTVNVFAFREDGKVTALSIYTTEIKPLRGFKRYKADYIALLHLAVQMDDKAWFNKIHEEFRNDYPIKK